jgi:hypothetical protein
MLAIGRLRSIALLPLNVATVVTGEILGAVEVLLFCQVFGQVHKHWQSDVSLLRSTLSRNSQ